MQNPGKNYILPESAFKPNTKLKFKPSKYAPGSLAEASYDVFFFHGKTYFDRWYDGDFNPALDRVMSPNHQTVQVFLTEKGTTREICRFSYKP